MVIRLIAAVITLALAAPAFAQAPHPPHVSAALVVSPTESVVP